ncbi:hypothetical protein [Verrucomicrobium sp. BvORR034]|uniref:hypothetical protein n=1 Tax=Verrucomicrobium sp. BvORR034 TaxID=1396418 RepID=UPI002240FCC6|nr:hypothetical protein [Verrucomicrobium sp. BvORR034]
MDTPVSTSSSATSELRGTSASDAQQAPRPRLRFPLLYFLLAIVLGFLLSLVALGAFRWEVREMCEWTGSRRDYIAYPLGVHTSVVYAPSALEFHLAKHHPDKLEHRWKSYSRISRNWLGTPYGIGPSPKGFFELPGFCIDKFMETANDAEILALYDLVRSGNEAAIEMRFQQLMDAAIP